MSIKSKHLIVVIGLLTCLIGNASELKKRFNAYPKNRNNERIQTHPDQIGNRITQDHAQRVEQGHELTKNIMKSDQKIRNAVVKSNSFYSKNYQPRIQNRTVIINKYFNRNPVFIRPVYVPFWHNHGFYGGFYYGFYPVLAIESFFFNPMVYWLFSPYHDPYYYQTWYVNEYHSYPTLKTPFLYNGIYYPTENLKTLLVAVSAMPVDRQAKFRDAISSFSQDIAQQLADITNRHVQLSTGDIVITHYEVLGYDDAIVVEGFVGQSGREFQFKGLLDLNHPELSLSFIPSDLNKDPNELNLTRLDLLNQRIKDSNKLYSADPGINNGSEKRGELSADPH